MRRQKSYLSDLAVFQKTRGHQQHQNQQKLDSWLPSSKNEKNTTYSLHARYVRSYIRDVGQEKGGEFL
jgi:hypothetical protein